MREIEFRAKRLDTGVWVYGWYAPLVCNDKTVIPVIKDRNGSDWRVDPATVTQFTGLTDKNGIKIYESDIVKFTKGLHGYKSTYDTYITKVEYHAEKCGTAQFSPFNTSDMIECEVIGNIYDNVELLTSGKEL